MTAEYLEVIRLDLPATPKYLSVLSACIAQVLERVDDLAERETITYNIQLAAHEVCANIVEHAYDGDASKRISISLTLLEWPDRLAIDIVDAGRSFELERTPMPNLDQPQVHGYGLFIIRSLMDEVVYLPQPGHNHWSLVKHF